MKKNYYDILGLTEVDKRLSEIEFKQVLKKKYREKCKENHPDNNPDNPESEERFKEVAAANDVLSDPDKRSNYDQFGHKGGGMHDNMEDVINQMRNQHRRRVRKGQNFNLNVNVSLEDVFNGVDKKFKYQKFQECKPCNGNGGHKFDTCPTCNGSGILIRKSQFGPHVIQEQVPCHGCNGKGQLNKDICKTCNGKGLDKIDTELEVHVPAGVEDGMHMISEGAGHGIVDGVDGDVIIRVIQKPHDIFTRSNHDLKVTLKLSYTQLVLGDKIEVVTIEGGRIRATIPPYSKVGDNLRVPNKGMSVLHSNGKRGDMILILGIDIPTKISDEEKELLKKLQDFRV